MRILLDTCLDTPAGVHLLDGSAPTLVMHGTNGCARDERYARVDRVAVEIRDGRLDLRAVMTMLAARGVNELQVEAGPTLCGALFAEGLVDELLLYVAPVLLGDDAKPLLSLPPLGAMADRAQLRVIDRRQVGEDMRLLLRPVGQSQ